MIDFFLLFSRHLLYVAESPENPLAKFLYLGTFGETPKEATRPIVILYDVEKVTFTPLKTIPEFYSAGEISWMPDSSGILGVVWPNYPYPAGCPHCANRKSQVQLNSNSITPGPRLNRIQLVQIVLIYSISVTYYL